MIYLFNVHSAWQCFPFPNGVADDVLQNYWTHKMCHENCNRDIWYKQKSFKVGTRGNRKSHIKKTLLMTKNSKTLSWYFLIYTLPNNPFPFQMEKWWSTSKTIGHIKCAMKTVTVTFDINRNSSKLPQDDIGVVTPSHFLYIKCYHDIYLMFTLPDNAFHFQME